MMIQSASAFKSSLASKKVIKPSFVAKSHTAIRCHKSSSCSSKEEKVKETEFQDGPLPSSQSVETFLSTLCSKTDVAEVIIEMPTYKMKVRRSISSKKSPVAAPAAPIVPLAAAPAPTSLPVAAPKAPAKAPVAVALESVDEENSVSVTAKKVGIFHRGRYAAGKRVGKNNCVNKGDRLKKGQTLGFIEQLGTHVPVECPVAGELIKFNVEDGKPVEYSQAICEITPFFGGYTGSDRATKVVA
nr:acetyl-CoA biotin carboxyl carrier (BCCP) [Polytomella parva]|mmetsp:Transcript_14332/g.25076  ORF Transcript_14332/g.25076 Transcript_14332/m.25076 type:complete len:243 (-) Transcript_14332:346-1074(-)|eukprot:CAMPEP_0175046906 /NCGR_PEP_ID=MMETSP0052_2-20121109/5292_1 /TAXON_ID=51329 ORGANISM="Polytomella parva, Strain SAG 63-3" /NCGR_SAMPLE_ID=MMETSP0052_2 /ASSEMBLY_ACC=CAM_ASM_000194 /LENGTH=242 /DNA_ID=CAMNT_0016310707 /DNA_START=27 /DNA_END=755 /DNA_ORIENTATION=-